MALCGFVTRDISLLVSCLTFSKEPISIYLSFLEIDFRHKVLFSVLNSTIFKILKKYNFRSTKTSKITDRKVHNMVRLVSQLVGQLS